jgi:hypothetical protein
MNLKSEISTLLLHFAESLSIQTTCFDKLSSCTSDHEIDSNQRCLIDYSGIKIKKLHEAHKITITLANFILLPKIGK